MGPGGPSLRIRSWHWVIAEMAENKWVNVTGVKKPWPDDLAIQNSRILFPNVGLVTFTTFVSGFMANHALEDQGPKSKPRVNFRRLSSHPFLGNPSLYCKSLFLCLEKTHPLQGNDGSWLTLNKKCKRMWSQRNPERSSSRAPWKNCVLRNRQENRERRTSFLSHYIWMVFWGGSREPYNNS